MTREEAKELYPIVKAFAEGKVIEYRTKPSAVSKSLQDLNRWLETKCLSFESDIEYRIKPESKYRPFKNGKECWNEMQKHQPFGWIQDKYITCYKFLTAIQDIGIYTIANCSYEIGFKNFVFADGTPFGIKIEK